MMQGIEHAAIASQDPDALANWYVSVLGFEVESKSARSGSYMLRAANGSRLEIIRSDSALPEVGMKDPGLRHMAIATDDFDADFARIQAGGVPLLTEPEAKGGNRVVFFRDPDGNILHLIQRGV